MGMCTQTEGGRGSKMDEYGQFCVLKTGGGSQKSLSISACSHGVIVDGPPVSDP